MKYLDPHFKKNLNRLNKSGEDLFFYKEIYSLLSKDFFEDSSHSALNLDAVVKMRSAALLLSKSLIDNDFKNIDQHVDFVEKDLSIWGEDQNARLFLRDFLLRQLKALKNDDVQKKIKHFTKPLLSFQKEQLVRASLRKEKNEAITDQDVKVLCLSAFLHPLRQTVGSCFATAPAIKIQREEPLLFLQDFQDLLNYGFIKRVYQGVEHQIPLSKGLELGYLNQPFQLSSFISSIESEEMIKILSDRIGEQRASSYLDEITNKEEASVITLHQLLEKVFSLKPKKESTKNVMDVLDSSKNLLSIQALRVKSDNEFHPDLEKARLKLLQIYHHPFLKAWEFTIASFAESESDFYKWNLYASLGLNSQEKGGIGEALYKQLQGQLDANSRQIEEYNKKYEEAFYQVKYLESRLKNAESTQMAGWARAEYQNHVLELNRIVNQREDIIEQNEKMSKILPKFAAVLDQLFPQYFQELYDPQMQDYHKNSYGDDPAGFRLVYKHGRSDSSLWTQIASEKEFIDSIKDFFVLVEGELKSHNDFEGLESLVEQMITTIIQTLNDPEFIRSSYKRTCERYQFDIHSVPSIEQLPYKPWAYLSGGTLEKLLHHYYKREKPFTKEVKKIATPLELFTFIVDVLRSFSKSKIDSFLRDSEKSLLMTSPTHAFLLQPSKWPLKELWETKDLYTYTWIRDRWTIPAREKLSNLEITPNQVQLFFVTYLKDPYLLLWFQQRGIWPNYSLSLSDFTKMLFQCLKQLPHHFSHYPLSPDIMVNWLQSFFPFVYKEQAVARLEEVLLNLNLDQKSYTSISHAFKLLLQEKVNSPGLGAISFFNLVKASIILLEDKNLLAQLNPGDVLNAFRKEKFFCLEPHCFADTNWAHFHFAFALDFSTYEPSLWRVEHAGTNHFPMLNWDYLFSESKPLEWTIFTNPQEYQMKV